MNSENLSMTSPELMSPDDTALLVVDVQGKLITLVPGHRRIIWNIGRLLDAAQLLGVTRFATEQYPQGLGPTTPELAARFEQIPTKSSFSCLGCPTLVEQLQALDLGRVLVVGIETHVCVQQTVLDLLGLGLRVYVAADAVGSRHEIDYKIALRRMESSGATLTTTESAIFEWCRTADRPEFKAISQLIRQAAPED